MSEDKVAKALGDYWTAQETGANWGNSVAGAAGASTYKPPSKKTGGGGGGGGGGGPDGCFPAGTKIATPHGKLAIEKLQSGERVFSFNKKKGIIEINKILQIKKHSENALWIIQFENGEKIRTTAIHSFFTNGKWKVARRVLPGEKLSSLDSSGNVINRRVTESKTTNQKEIVYNLIVDKNYSFIAEGMLVHSFTYLRALRTIIWSLLGIIHQKHNTKTIKEIHFCTRL